MSIEFAINATSRTELGSGASRRLRRAGRLPGILYGGDRDPQMITLDHNEVVLSLRHEAFFSHILTLNLDGKSEKVVLRDLQRHPFKPTLVHIDLLRVTQDHSIRMHVPVHLLNADSCKGVKTGGGMLNLQTNEIEVECLPGSLPEAIEVDVSELELGDALHLSQLSLPPGVSIPALTHGAEYDGVVVSVLSSRGEKLASEEEGQA
jgi:large subunit ribosomal protein L25